MKELRQHRQIQPARGLSQHQPTSSQKGRPRVFFDSPNLEKVLCSESICHQQHSLQKRDKNKLASNLTQRRCAQHCPRIFQGILRASSMTGHHPRILPVIRPVRDARPAPALGTISVTSKSMSKGKQQTICAGNKVPMRRMPNQQQTRLTTRRVHHL